jgi:hypothetical protein
MNVLEQKPVGHYKEELKRLIKLLTYKKNKLTLAGSASLSSQRFFSDYDLSCMIQRPDKDDFFTFCQHLTTHPIEDVWFIELKLQTTQGKKVRVYAGGTLKKADWDRVWDKLEFVKVDLVARVEGFFIDVSCIYTITPSHPTPEEYEKSLMDEIKDLKTEKKWFKVLKRYFNLAKFNHNKKETLRLSKIFNSPLGEEYQLINRITAMDRVLEHYQDPGTIKKVTLGIKDLHLPEGIDKLSQWVEEKSVALNKEAKKFL